MRQRFFAAVVLTLTGSSGAAEDRVRIILNGVWNPAPSSINETRSITEFAETGSFSARYTTKSVFGPDVGAQVTVFRRLGVFAAFSSANRDESGMFEAGLPHPLYLNRHRDVSGELSGYQFKERAFHLDLAFGSAKGHLDYALFAGVSLFDVEADFVDAVRYSHAYPYDTVTLNQVLPKRAKDKPTGFNAGGRLDYRFGGSRRFGLGAQLRISGATAKLKPTDSNTLSIDAGGFQAGIGARLYF